MSPAEPRTFFASLKTLFDKGVRYSTVIDVGCADGQFFLELNEAGLSVDARPLNLDANSLYEGSLAAIKKVVGGDYRICAVGDREGEVEMTMAVHPYWSSLRPAGDLYWRRINDLVATKKTVPLTTLDALSRQLALQPRFLLKLDVQGAEAEVLRGAAEVLKQTQAVVCETDVDDFDTVHAILTESGFVLYDLTTVNRLADGTLCWFYPVYVNRTLDEVRPKAFWDSRQNDGVIRAQDARRGSILKSNAEILERIRKRGAAAPHRNDPCPCGSGKRYKHCHGVVA